MTATGHVPAADARRLTITSPHLLRAVWRSRNGRIGLILIVLVALGALVSAVGLTPHDPQAQDPNATLRGLSLGHLFGTDQFGRDVFSLVLSGIGVSLEIACIATLIAERVAFFVLRAGGLPAGCGGIQLFGTTYGELKRMYVRPQFRGLGFGKLLVEHLADYARSHGVGLLRLETGIHQIAAIALYERMGFQRIPPFGDYFEDPNSLYYEKHIGDGVGDRP